MDGTRGSVLGYTELRVCGNVRTLFNSPTFCSRAVCSRATVCDCRPVTVHPYKRAHIYIHTYTHIYIHTHEHIKIHIRTNNTRFVAVAIAHAALCMDAIIGKHFAIREKTTFHPFARLADQTTPSVHEVPRVNREVCTRCVEITPGMMYYARRICEYRPERENTVLAREISRIMRAQCASGTVDLAHSTGNARNCPK